MPRPPHESMRMARKCDRDAVFRALDPLQCNRRADPYTPAHNGRLRRLHCQPHCYRASRAHSERPYCADIFSRPITPRPPRGGTVIASNSAQIVLALRSHFRCPALAVSRPLASASAYRRDAPRAPLPSLISPFSAALAPRPALPCTAALYARRRGRNGAERCRGARLPDRSCRG